MGRNDARIRLHALYIRRLEQSRLRAHLHDRIVDDVEALPGVSLVVDVGCGPGLLEARLAARLPDLRAVGVDLDPRMLEAARAERGVEAVQANVARLPFRTGSVPLIISSASFKDWGDAEGGLREIRRALAPGGRALVYDFVTAGEGSSPPAFAARFGLASDLLRRAARFVWPFTVDDARTLARRAGGEPPATIEVWRDLGVVRLEIRRNPEGAR